MKGDAAKVEIIGKLSVEVFMDRSLNLLYFSPTNTTAQIVKKIASGISEIAKEYNLTLPTDRLDEINFGSNDVVIIGVPVYAGRVPEILTDYFTKASCVVL